MVLPYPAATGGKDFSPCSYACNCVLRSSRCLPIPLFTLRMRDGGIDRHTTFRVRLTDDARHALGPLTLTTGQEADHNLRLRHRSGHVLGGTPVGMPGKHSPTSPTILDRFWEPVMQPLYDNCMTLAVKRAVLTCRPHDGMFRL
jgi:hypothetical protein